TVPIAPSGLTATPLSPTQVRATWTDGSFNESGFRIDRSSSASGPWTLAGSVGANVTTFVDSTAAENTTYFYRVAPFNTAGERVSNTASATTPKPVPIAPSGLTATAASASSVNLSWTD